MKLVHHNKITLNMVNYMVLVVPTQVTSPFPVRLVLLIYTLHKISLATQASANILFLMLTELLSLISDGFTMSVMTVLHVLWF